MIKSSNKVMVVNLLSKVVVKLGWYPNGMIIKHH